MGYLNILVIFNLNFIDMLVDIPSFIDPQILAKTKTYY